MNEPATSVLPRWRTGTVASGGEDIYYEVVEIEDGTPRPTVVLTHGAGGTHAIWYQQVVAFAREYRVVTWDARGFGNSTYRTKQHGATQSAGDLEGVLDATETRDAHLVGQSMGGWWVTTFALAHPERTRSLVLTNTVGGLWTDELLVAYGEYVQTARADAIGRAGRHPALGEEAAAGDLAHAFLYQQLGTFHTPPFVDVANALAGTRHPHADVRALGIPTLMVTGSVDPIFSAHHVRDVANRVGAELVEIDGAGHSPYWEQPAQYNAILLDFLGRAEQARG